MEEGNSLESLAVEKPGPKRNNEPKTPTQTPGTSGQAKERKKGMRGETNPKKGMKGTIKHIDRQKCENPFDCGHCGIWFPQMSTMMAHMKIHEKPYYCEKCCQSFDQLVTLNGHLERKDKCPHCCEEFRDPGDLNEHIQMRHGGKHLSTDVESSAIGKSKEAD